MTIAWWLCSDVYQAVALFMVSVHGVLIDFGASGMAHANIFAI